MIESRAPAVIVSYSKHAQLTVLRRIPFTWRQICESVLLHTPRGFAALLRRQSAD